MPNYVVKTLNINAQRNEDAYIDEMIEADLYAIGASGELTFLKLRPLGQGIRPILSIPDKRWYAVAEFGEPEVEEAPQNHGLVEG